MIGASPYPILCAPYYIAQNEMWIVGKTKCGKMAQNEMDVFLVKHGGEDGVLTVYERQSSEDFYFLIAFFRLSYLLTMIPYIAPHVANTSAKHATSAQYHGCQRTPSDDTHHTFSADLYMSMAIR